MPRALVIRAEGTSSPAASTCTCSTGLTPEQARRLSATCAIIHKLEELPFPTIASVQGLCLTAGFELALGCDIIWPAESARFGLVERVVGLTPAMGGTQRIAERAGPARAREFVMTRRPVRRRDARALERGEPRPAGRDLRRRR